MICERKIERSLSINDRYLDKDRTFVTSPPPCLVENSLPDYLDDNRHSIAIDYFKMFCEMQTETPMPEIEGETIEVGAFSMVFKGFGTAQYQCLWDVYTDKGEIFGSAETHPRKGLKIRENAVSFKIENSYLYMKGWSKMVFDLTAAAGWCFVSISRLDIAVDGLQKINKLLQRYEFDMLSGSSIYPVCRKGRGSTRDKSKAVFGGTPEVKGEIKDFQKCGANEKDGLTYFFIGSPKSTKQVVCYNKSREIEMNSGKKYIERFWEANDMQVTAEVWRLELRCKSEALKQIGVFTPSDLENPRLLISIFETCTKNFFEFHYKTDSNSSRCKPIQFVDFQKLGSKLIAKFKKKATGDRWKAKILCHLVHKLRFQGRHIEVDKDVISMGKIIKDFDLQDYVDEKEIYWKEQYERHTNKEIVRRYIMDQAVKLQKMPYDYLRHYERTDEMDYFLCKRKGFNGSEADFRRVLGRFTKNPDLIFES